MPDYRYKKLADRAFYSLRVISESLRNKEFDLKHDTIDIEIALDALSNISPVHEDAVVNQSDAYKIIDKIDLNFSEVTESELKEIEELLKLLDSEGDSNNTGKYVVFVLAGLALLTVVLMVFV